MGGWGAPRRPRGPCVLVTYKSLFFIGILSLCLLAFWSRLRVSSGEWKILWNYKFSKATNFHTWRAVFRSPMSIRPTCCGCQEQQVKLAMDVVERKEVKKRARMTPGKIDHELHNVKNTWRLEHTKEGRCVTLARWCVGMNVDVVNVQSFFPFSVLRGLLLFSNKVGHGERGIFAYDCVVGLQTWRDCTDHHVSVGTGLPELTMMCPTPNGQYSARMIWPLRLCCIRVSYRRFSAEHFFFF